MNPSVKQVLQQLPKIKRPQLSSNQHVQIADIMLDLRRNKCEDKLLMSWEVLLTASQDPQEK